MNETSSVTPLVGRDPALEAQLRAAHLVAATDVPVLIQGESGTGKDLLAHLLHARSPRAAGPLIAVNCAALPADLAESLLYGHRRGSFTGADTDHPGLVREAHGGTLLLDEIGDMPAGLQAKLLRFLESGEFQPIGAPRAERADARVIAATNRDLAAEVAAGRFRADLFYRLNVVPLALPPLRERLDDLPLLIDHFLAELSRRHGLPAPRLGRDALQRLRRWHWPGNVRELRNLCERLLILFPGGTVGADNLPPEIRAGQPARARPLLELPGEGLSLRELEIELIRQALARAGGNRSRAARLLGLTRDTLLYRLKKYAIGA